MLPYSLRPPINDVPLSIDEAAPWGSISGEAGPMQLRWNTDIELVTRGLPLALSRLSDHCAATKGALTVKERCITLLLCYFSALQIHQRKGTARPGDKNATAFIKEMGLFSSTISSKFQKTVHLSLN